MLLRELDNNLGLVEAFSNCIFDPRDPNIVNPTIPFALKPAFAKAAADSYPRKSFLNERTSWDHYISVLLVMAKPCQHSQRQIVKTDKVLKNL